MKQLNPINFTPNDKVEIIKSRNYSSATSFYPATIILRESHQTKTRKKRKKTSNNRNKQDDDDFEEDDDEDQQYMVEYKTPDKDVVTFVNGSEIRPVPPEFDAENCRNFDVGEKVDVLIDGCWRKADILGVLYEGLRYVVKFDGDDDVPIEVGRSCLRVHRDWYQGSWIPPLDFHQMEQGATSDPHKRLKLKVRIKGTKRQVEAKFSPGTAVEVKSDEDGYQGSWYTAIVVGSAGVGKFLVEYQTLKTEDETELLKEIANEQDMRPCPPEIEDSNRYEVLEEIDAWYNDGWWEGLIYEVLDGWKYIVYFASTHEKLVFQHPNLRPHQNWVDGKWVRNSMKSRMAMKLAAEEALQETFRAGNKWEFDHLSMRPCQDWTGGKWIGYKHGSPVLKLKSSSCEKKNDRSEADRNFFKGTMVEVRNDEQGYKGSWYSAVIVRLTRKGRYLVEYLTLKTEDNREYLREEAEIENIRPCPPWIEVNGNYLLLEKVDAWHNDGWWEGVISKILADKKYMVYFETYNEELEFDHVNVRAHQEWINGNWIIANQDTGLLAKKLLQSREHAANSMQRKHHSTGQFSMNGRGYYHFTIEPKLGYRVQSSICR